MSEYIVRETGYPGAIEQEIVGELVRCKDCQWWERDSQPRYHSDERPCNILGMGTPPEWFCADGEVRESTRCRNMRRGASAIARSASC